MSQKVSRPSANAPWSPPNLSTWLTQVDETQYWLLPGFIPQDAHTLMSGQQKRAAKTMTALAMTLSLATKTKYALFEPPKKTKVCYVLEEGAKAETKQRIVSIAKGMKIDPYTALTNVSWVFRERVKLDDDKWRIRLVKHCAETKAELIVLDAMSYLHKGDENDTKEMIQVVDTLQALRQTGASTLYLAHLDKVRGENPKADIDTQVRGSSVTVNAYDNHIANRRYHMRDAHIDVIVRPRGGEERFYSMAWDFPGAGEDGGAKLSMTEKNAGDIDDKFVTKCERKLKEDKTYSLTALRELWDVSKKVGMAVIEKLEDQGRLEEDGEDWRVV